MQRAILKKGPARNKKAGGWKGTIELLLIIAGAIVVIILGFYGGLHRLTTTKPAVQVTQNTIGVYRKLCRKMTWKC